MRHQRSSHRRRLSWRRVPRPAVPSWPIRPRRAVHPAATADRPAAPIPSRSSCHATTARTTADRVVVLHGPPHRTDAAAATAATYRLRVRDLPRRTGAFPTSWASHLAITDETGDRFHYAQRLEVGDLVDRSLPRATARQRVRPRDHRARPDAAGDARQTRRGRWPAGTAPITARPCIPGRGGDRWAAVAGRWTSAEERQAPALHDAMAGSTSGLAAVVLLLADRHVGPGTLILGDTASPVDRVGVVRPPVGRLHQCRRWRLGLVRSEPR
jgi:hypothetical protein